MLTKAHLWRAFPIALMLLLLVPTNMGIDMNNNRALALDTGPPASMLVNSNIIPANMPIGGFLADINLAPDIPGVVQSRRGRTINAQHPNANVNTAAGTTNTNSHLSHGGWTHLTG